MPRYFLHLRRHAGADGVALDHEGDELASEDLLREHVLETARDLTARARIEVIRNWYDCSFEVTDQGGQLVMTVPFDDLVRETP